MKPLICKYIEAVKCWDGVGGAGAHVASTGRGGDVCGESRGGPENPNSPAQPVTNSMRSRRVGKVLAAVAGFPDSQELAVGTDGRTIPHNLVAILRVARGMRRRQEVGACVPGGQKGGDRNGPSDATDDLLVHGNSLFRSDVISQGCIKLHLACALQLHV